MLEINGTYKEFDDFWEHFTEKNYIRQCDVVDEKINNLLYGSKEEFIEFKDIPQYLDINYLRDKIKILEAYMPIKFEWEKDFVNYGFIIRLKK